MGKIFNLPSVILTFRNAYSIFRWPGTRKGLSEFGSRRFLSPTLYIVIFFIMIASMVWLIPWVAITGYKFIAFITAQNAEPQKLSVNYDTGLKFKLEKAIELEIPGAKPAKLTVPKGTTVYPVFTGKNAETCYVKDDKGNMFWINSPAEQLDITGQEIEIYFYKRPEREIITDLSRPTMYGFKDEIKITPQDIEGKKITVTAKQTLYFKNNSEANKGSGRIVFTIAADGKKLGYLTSGFKETFLRKLPYWAKAEHLLTSQDVEELIVGQPLTETEKIFGYAETIIKNKNGETTALFDNFFGDKKGGKRPTLLVLTTDKNGIVKNFSFEGPYKSYSITDRMPIMSKLMDYKSVRKYLRIDDGAYIETPEGIIKRQKNSRGFDDFVPEKYRTNLIIQIILVLVASVIGIAIVGAGSLPPFLISFFIPLTLLIGIRKLPNFVVYAVPWLTATVFCFFALALAFITSDFASAVWAFGIAIVAWYVYIAPEIWRELGYYRCFNCKAWDSYSLSDVYDTGYETVTTTTKIDRGVKTVDEKTNKNIIVTFTCKCCGQQRAF